MLVVSPGLCSNNRIKPIFSFFNYLATCCHGSHTQCNKCSLRGAFFVLQLHDELIYEVNEQDLNQVAALVKYTMESAMKLSVCLPVKLKMGPTWGSIEEIHI